MAARLRAALQSMPKTKHARTTPSESFTLSPAVFRVRAYPTAEQARLFQQLWTLTCKTDEFAWLAAQVILQQRRMPSAAELLTGATPLGLIHPAPGRSAFQPAAIQREQDRSEETIGTVTYRRLTVLLKNALCLWDPTYSRRPGSWNGDWVPMGVIEGAVRRMYGPLMHIRGLLDEVPFGRLPEIRGPSSLPQVTLSSVQPDGPCAVQLWRSEGPERLAAELFTLPPHWRRVVLGESVSSAVGADDTAERLVVQKAASSIAAGTLECVDGAWWLWLRLGKAAGALPPRGPAPTWGSVAIDPGMRRWLTGHDGDRALPTLKLSLSLEAQHLIGSTGRGDSLMATVHHEDRYGLSLIAQDDTIEERLAAFTRMEPYLEAAYWQYADYERIVIEASSVGERTTAHFQPQPLAGLPTLPFMVFQDRSFLPVLMDWWAADFWPGIGRRSVVWAPRMRSSRCCPVCLRRKQLGEVQRVGRLVRNGGRRVHCDACGLRMDRDAAAALNHLQRSVWLGRMLPHVWTGLPADIQVSLRGVTPLAAIQFRAGASGPADELDWRRRVPPAGLMWEDPQYMEIDDEWNDWQEELLGGDDEGEPDAG